MTIALANADGGTDVLAVHEALPRGVPSADNEAGSREALAKLAALVEADEDYVQPLSHARIFFAILPDSPNTDSPKRNGG